MLFRNKTLIMQKLVSTGAHLGYRAAHSNFQPYLYGFRNKTAIIDLETTLFHLRRACNFICLIARSKGNLLLVNTNLEYNQIVQYAAKQTNQSYINYKWIGGLLTNWNHMQTVQRHFQPFVTRTKHTMQSQSLESNHYAHSSCFSSPLTRTDQGPKVSGKAIERKHSTGSEILCEAQGSQISTERRISPISTKGLQHSTKGRGRERGRGPKGSTEKRGSKDSGKARGREHSTGSKMSNEARSILSKPNRQNKEWRKLLYSLPQFHKMQKGFEGLLAFPDCIILLNANHNCNAIREAAKLQIPIISLVDSTVPNHILNLIPYPIPANENSLQFVYLFCNCIVKAMLSSSFHLPSGAQRSRIK